MGNTTIKKELRRPNEEALRRLLKKHSNSVEELILRLAWQGGLTRQEILDLKWADISFDDGILNLPRRRVPLVDELSLCLAVRGIMMPDKLVSESTFSYVVYTDGYHTHPTKVHLSRLVAAALDEEETLRGLRLDDLRNDFIIRILEKKSITYAMEVAGINRVSINTTFVDYLPVREPNEKRRRNRYERIDEQRLRALIQAEESSEVAITLQLSWELGFSLPGIISLTWEQICFEKKELRTEKDVYSLSDTLIQMLQESFSKRIPSKDSHILLTPRSKQPFNKDRLSKVVRNALVRGGLENLELSRLSYSSQKKDRLEKVYSYIREHGSINGREVAAIWGVSNTVAQRNLRDMVVQRLLAQKGKTNGVKYYLPEDDII